MVQRVHKLQKEKQGNEHWEQSARHQHQEFVSVSKSCKKAKNKEKTEEGLERYQKSRGMALTSRSKVKPVEAEQDAQQQKKPAIFAEVERIKVIRHHNEGDESPRFDSTFQ